MGLHTKLDMDIHNHIEIKQLFDELLTHAINNIEDLEHFILMETNILMEIHDKMTECNVRFHCDINDKEKQKLFEDMISNISLLVERYNHLSAEKILKNQFVEHLDSEKYAFFIKRKRNFISLYKEENLKLQLEIERLKQEYESIMGNLTIEWGGELKKIPQMQVILKDSNRNVRKKAWKSIQEKTLSVKHSIDLIMDKMVQTHHQIAINAGYKNFVDYMFDKYERFDYSIEDCEQFHKSVECYVVPLLDEIQKNHKDSLGLNTYRPWDEQAVSNSTQPLVPFNTHIELTEKTIKLFSEIDFEFGHIIKFLQRNNLLDIECRHSKAPGGFTEPIYTKNSSFIFMNATNTQFDLQTMIHETGHAIHNTLSNQKQSLFMYKNPAIEVGELASQSMELITMDKWGIFYNDSKSLKLAQREQVESIVSFLVWIAFVDSFQIWMYTNPNHTRKEREEKVIELSLRFNNHFVDWSGLETEMTLRWQRLMHIFVAPLYYIEYGMSQIGALQLWKCYQDNPEETLKKLKQALEMGSSKPITEIYFKAGISVDMSAGKISQLMTVCKEFLNS
ncbi:M3 family oligoendopeptidase [Priestia megaterium]|uniref:M3 family oligoendopeptidase n=1 Tax=Priestia megaterium TaxID=1404 RepID=UPI000CA2793F|nr:M3 family oligoendopeptidase [Priestia megaterium]AUO14637.1 M3 family oligoendopeptidase [Priestia megaterium]